MPEHTGESAGVVRCYPQVAPGDDSRTAGPRAGATHAKAGISLKRRACMTSGAVNLNSYKSSPPGKRRNYCLGRVRLIVESVTPRRDMRQPGPMVFAAQGFAILHAGLKAQLRSTPSTHHSTPHVAPTKPVSSPME